MCIDTEPWTPPDHRLRCNRTVLGSVIDPTEDEDDPFDIPGSVQLQNLCFMQSYNKSYDSCADA